MNLAPLFDGDWQDRLKVVTELMRDVSRETDPQRLVQQYSRRMRELLPHDVFVSLTRRDLPAPHYQVTRTDAWGPDFNPWKDRHTRPVYKGGLLGDVLYRGESVVIDDLAGAYAADDPLAWVLEGQRSLMAIPLFDNGVAVNMLALLRRDAAAFRRETLPEQTWLSNLFGRATTNLVLGKQLESLNEALQREMGAVARIQRSLLPRELPTLAGMRFAQHYQTSAQSGGDYYDFFELPGGKLGMLLADVSGHGTPAAVIMAVVHAIAHAIDTPPHPEPPGRLLRFINRHLCERYTRDGTFVTAFYGVYDPATRRLSYANAGHPPPRIKNDFSRGGRVARSLDGIRSLPLGILPDEAYEEESVTLESGDVIVLFTDGIIEARQGGMTGGELWGTAGLDAVLAECSCDPTKLVKQVVEAVETYSGHTAPQDDRTLVVAKVG